MAGTGCTDSELFLKRLVAARLKVEFMYSTLVGELGEFEGRWAVGNVLCSVRGKVLVLNF